MKKMEASLHCWWGCKLIQPLWKMVWRCFKNHENNFTFLRHNVEQKDHWCGVGTPGSSFQPCHLILVKTQTPPDFICFIWKWEDHLRGQTCLSYYHVKRHSFKKKKKSLVRIWRAQWELWCQGTWFAGEILAEPSRTPPTHGVLLNHCSGWALSGMVKVEEAHRPFTSAWPHSTQRRVTLATGSKCVGPEPSRVPRLSPQARVRPEMQSVLLSAVCMRGLCSWGHMMVMWEC